MPKFEPGQSGNRKGRPKNEQAITPLLRKLLAEKRAGKTRAEHVVDAWIRAAEQGDINAIRSLAERVDGKPVQPISGAEDAPPLEIVIRR